MISNQTETRIPSAKLYLALTFAKIDILQMCLAKSRVLIVCTRVPYLSEIQSPSIPTMWNTANAIVPDTPLRGAVYFCLIF